MKRIAWAAVAAGAVFFAGCNGPHLSIASDPDLNVPAETSYYFAALVQDSDDTVVWKLSGPGTLSNASGTETIYTAPAWPPPKNTATLTATLSSTPEETRTINITITKPSNLVSGLPSLDNDVLVTYDERDIPTVNCTTTADCYTVLGYIHARDRFLQMDFYRRVGRGTLAELVGDSGLETDESLRTLFTTRTGARMLDGFTAHVQSDPVVAPLLAAYTAGVNAWLDTMRASGKLPPGYDQLLYPITTSKDDIPDWSDEDTLAVARLFEFQLSETVEDEADYGRWASTFASDPIAVGVWIQSRSVIQSYTLSGSGAPNAPSLVASPGSLDALRVARPALDKANRLLDAVRKVRQSMGEPSGSNNWVVDGQHTDIGQAVIANDPHQPLTYPSNFHLSHLISAQNGLNVMGGVFPGVPTVLTGRGAHVGWGDTVVGYDVTDLYLETLVPISGSPLPGISFKGQTVPLIASPQTYRFRTPTGTLATLGAPPPVLVSPPHGPIISFDATHGVAISARWTGQETETDDIQAIFRLNNAASVDDARQALEGDPLPDGGRLTGFWTGAQNFVLADDQGRIGYVPHACVPQRPWAQTNAIYPYPVVPMDGRGNFEWATGPDGGLLCVPDDQLPRAIGSTKGYLATANSDPLGATADNNPYQNNPNNTPYLSFEWSDPLGFRIGRIQEVLDAKTDGGVASLADLQALQSDHVLTLARPFLLAINGIMNGPNPPSDPDVLAAVQLLGQWATSATPLDCPTGLVPGATDPTLAAKDPDPVNSQNSAACLLFHTFLRRVLETTFVDEETAAGVGRRPPSEIRGLLSLLQLEAQGQNPNHSLCSDVNAKGEKVTDRTCVSQVVNALGWSYARLRGVYGDVDNWRWGRVHTITFAFVISGYPVVDRSHQPGPFPRPGGAWTVDVGSPRPSTSMDLSFPYGSGGAVRWLAAMDGKKEHTFDQLPGTESDGPYPLGKDTMLLQWTLNRYFNFPFQPNEVSSVRTEQFGP